MAQSFAPNSVNSQQYLFLYHEQNTKQGGLQFLPTTFLRPVKRSTSSSAPSDKKQDFWRNIFCNIKSKNHLWPEASTPIYEDTKVGYATFTQGI